MTDTLHLSRILGETMNVAFTMLMVDDLSAAKRFYTDVLGFSVAQESPERVHFLCGSSEFVAFQCERPAAKGVHGVDSSSVIVLAVEDLEVKMAEMKSLGVRFIHDTPASNELGQYAAFYDPSGIVHEIFERSC